MTKVKAYEFPEKVFTEKRNVSVSWTNSVDINLKHIKHDVLALAFLIAEINSDLEGK